jgi:autotransporter-associated beta strand protein
MDPLNPPRLVCISTALFVAVFAMFALSAPLSAQQTYTWDGDAGGQSGDWGNRTNWVGDPSPLTFNNQTDIIFSQSAMTTNTVWTYLGTASRTVRSLTFGPNIVGNTNTFDIRLLTNSSSGAANLILSAASGNASITVDQSTSGVAQIRLGNGNGGRIVLNSNLDLVQNNTFLTNAFQIGNSLTNSGTINKSGAGAVSVVQNNAGWSGGMNINEGEVFIYSDANAMGTGTWTLGGGTNNTTLAVGTAVTISNSGGLVVAAGTGTRTIANAATNVAVGNATLSGAITNNKDVIFNIANYASGTDRMTVSGAIGGTGGIIKTGTGLLQLSGANTYSGDTVLEVGNIATTAANSLPGASVLRFGATNTNRRLQLQGFNQTLGGVDSTAATGGILVVEAAVDGGNNAPATLTLDVAAGTNHTFSGLVRNAAGGATNSALTLVKSGAGTQVLSGGTTVSYSGTTTVDAGVLEFGGTNTVANNSAITVNSGGTMRFSGGGTRSNTISGSGNLEKTGANSLTLSGNNTYQGNTTVSAGALSVAPAGALTFTIGGSGTNNALLGTGTTSVDGQFAFDLSAASTNTNATWTIVANTLTNSYGTNFIVTGFNGAGGLWTNTTNGVNYVFAQSNSVLSVQSTGAATPYDAWVTYWQGVDPNFTNTAGTDNPDGDPFDNNEEFAFDGNPAVGTGALLTAVKVGTNAVFNYVAQTNTNAVTYQVQVTGNLTNGWTNASVTISNSLNQTNPVISQTNLYERKEFVVPAAGQEFYRVQATIAP